MRFDTKIAIAVREDLAVWQQLNVTAFLASAVAGGHPGVIGEPYADGSGTRYLPMFRQPVLIYAADAEALSEVRARAAGRGLAVAVYTEDMFKTTHDAANRDAVKAVARADLNLVGLAMRAERKLIDKIVDGLKFHS